MGLPRATCSASERAPSDSFHRAPRQRVEDDRLAVRGARRRGIVQQQDVAASKAAAEPRRHARAIARHGVETPPRPGHQRQAGAGEHDTAARDSECRPGRERTVGRPPPDRSMAACARSNFLPESARSSERESVRVAVGVVLHTVPAARGWRPRYPGCASARRPTQKNVARAPDCSSRSRTAGVNSGSRTVIEGERDDAPVCLVRRADA